MSVLIKGIDMPRNIDESLIFAICDDKAVCISTCSEYEAVEVPTPHGRLADCDAVKECLHEVTDCDDKIYALGLLEWAVAKRTVIEAEVEE